MASLCSSPALKVNKANRWPRTTVERGVKPRLCCKTSSTVYFSQYMTVVFQGVLPSIVAKYHNNFSLLAIFISKYGYC